MVRQQFPEKKIGVVFPLGQKRSDELAKVATFFRYMESVHLKKSFLPMEISIDGGKKIVRPSSYDPPEENP